MVVHQKITNFSIIINIIIIIIGLLSKLILPPEIPLFFGLPQTSEILAPSTFIILPSIVALIIALFNFLLASKIDNNYLKKAFNFATLAVTFLSLIATIKIILLVGSI